MMANTFLSFTLAGRGLQEAEVCQHPVAGKDTSQLEKSWKASIHNLRNVLLVEIVHVLGMTPPNTLPFYSCILTLLY